MDRPTDVADVDPAESARLRHRDRKRTTPMVVDNAGVKRLQLARAAREEARRRRESPSADRRPPAPG